MVCCVLGTPEDKVSTPSDVPWGSHAGIPTQIALLVGRVVLQPVKCQRKQRSERTGVTRGVVAIWLNLAIE